MTEQRNAVYTLGKIIGGTRYVYSQLGTFRSAQAAIQRCGERGAMVFREYDCVKGGCVFGTTEAECVAVVL